MKNFLCILLLLATLVSIVACTGPQGPVGPPGPKGDTGVAGPLGPGNATVIQVYTQSIFKGLNDIFSSLPMTRRGEKIIVAGVGFKIGETVRIYIEKKLAATSTALGDAGMFKVDATVPLEVTVSDDPAIFHQMAVEAIGDKGSLARFIIMVGR